MMRDSNDAEALIQVRTYGTRGPTVVVLHGGPGAAGYIAPVCRELSDSFRVLEPLQRMSEGEPLSVRRHVTDLHDVISLHCEAARPALVGHSWGAMLALAYAAAHPDRAGALVLVACGTFDESSRREYLSAVECRLDPRLRSRLREVSRTIADADVRMCVTGRLLEPVYSYDLLPHPDETEFYDARGHEETWKDMMHLQRTGVYPAAFGHITAPSVMLHGVDDSHPGESIWRCLGSVMPQLEYCELPHCGHYPWYERHACEEFYDLLRQWLAIHAT